VGAVSYFSDREYYDDVVSFQLMSALHTHIHESKGVDYLMIYLFENTVAMQCGRQHTHPASNCFLLLKIWKQLTYSIKCSVKQAHAQELPKGIDMSKYIASGLVVFDLRTRIVKWSVHLDLSTDSTAFRACATKPSHLLKMNCF